MNNMIMEIKLPTNIEKKPKWFVASCPQLDVFTQGNTEKEAKDNLHEALTSFFISCLERGTLEAVLKECGFEPVHSSLEPEIKKNSDIQKQNFINIPLNFLSNKRLEPCLA
jgi:predicted RNase H-like HicB family nuclease